MFLIKIKKTFLTLLLTILGVTIGVNFSHGITRDLIIVNADAYASHSWYCSWENTQYCNTNNCPVSGSAFDIGYQTGVAYKWGGFDTIANFDSKLSQDYTAGDVTGTTCVADCATGVDCSGFVSRCWGLTTKYSTSTLPNISIAIPQSSLQEGDILNYPGSHVVLFDYLTGSGSPVIYEAVYGSPHKVYYHTSSWSYLNGYTPRKYNNIEETGYASVSQGVTVSPTPVVLGQNFTVSFTLKETNGAPITFEHIEVAIHRSDGSYLQRVEMYDNVSIGANGTWSRSPTSQLNGISPGTYRANVSGVVPGGNWFDFSVTDSGVNPRSFTVENPVTLSYITISGSTQVNENSGAQYTCTAYYSDGSSSNVTSSSSWSENSSYASISSSGYLTTSSVSSDQSCTITATYGGKSDTHNVTIKNVPATLSYITISGSTQVNENSGAQYACTAYYSDGSSSNVTSSASWSENSSYASISSSGYLTTLSVSSDQSCTITASYGGKSDTHSVTIKNVPDITPPMPNPMTWVTQPYAASSTSISMVATTATDSVSPPVSYLFDFVSSPTGGSGGSDSSWQSSTSYTDTGLQANHQYGYRVKARDSASTPNETDYSSTVYKYTHANAPGTSSFSNVTQTSIRANWTTNGNLSGTEYYCENTSAVTNSGWTTNTYWNSAGLICGTSYTFRVKARNGNGTQTGWTNLGSQSTQLCLSTPTVTTTVVSSITSNSAFSGGNVTSDGGAFVTARGVCWSTSANPTTSDNHTTNGTGTGSFTSSITGLSPNTPYHVRAYATNSEGTGYGSEEAFTTKGEGGKAMPWLHLLLLGD